MQFTIPTTKAEMYNVLQTMFNFYRIQRQGYNAPVMSGISVSRLSFTPLTNAQLESKAQTLLLAEQKKRELAKQEELTVKIASLTQEIEEITTKTATQIATTTSLYNDSEDKVEREAVKKGLSQSNIVLDKIAQLEQQKNDKILEITTESDSKIASMQSQITALDAQLSDISTYYGDVSESEIDAKVIELKDAQDKVVREVSKYNNSVEEREQRSENNVKEVQATLQLRFMEIKSNYFTKDQLVEMGYYTDVIDCVCSYYDQMSDANAYTSIKSESKLAIYLDDYYESIVYMYKCRAGE